MSAGNVFSGARAVFRMDGQKVAYAFGCNGSEEIMHEEVNVLDNVEVEEHITVGYRVSFSAEIFRTVKGTPNAPQPREGVHGSLKAMGIFPKVGADPLNALTQPDMTSTISDRLTDTILMQMERVKAASKNFSITARGIVGQNVSFVGVRMKDESEISGS